MHWYDRAGNPCYEQPMATKPGETRPTTLRDARKLDLLPSVTTVMSISEKEQIIQYRIRCAIQSAMVMPRMDDEPEEDYIRRVIGDSKDHSRTAMNFGSALHDAIESLIRNGETSPDDELVPYLQGFAEWYKANRESLRGCVVDWKTQGSEDKLTFYPDWVIQLAAYRRGRYWTGQREQTDGPELEIPFACQLGFGGKIDFAWMTGRAPKLVSVAISSKVPGLIERKTWSTAEARWGWRVFSKALAHWIAVKKYDPRWKDADNVDERNDEGNIDGTVEGPGRIESGPVEQGQPPLQEQVCGPVGSVGDV